MWKFEAIKIQRRTKLFLRLLTLVIFSTSLVILIKYIESSKDAIFIVISMVGVFNLWYMGRE